MTKLHKAAALTIFLACVAGCGGSNTTTVGTPGYGGDLLTNSQRQDIATTATTRLTNGKAPQVTAGANQFGFDLFAKAVKAQPDKNICLSAVSIGSVLAMLADGSQGETRRQIDAALNVAKVNQSDIDEANKHFIEMMGNIDPDKVTLNIANSLWVNQGTQLNPDFAQKDQTYYQAKVSTLDFRAPEAASSINDWVNQSTRGKISTIVDRIPQDARLYVINAVYFKGAWKNPFDKNQTQSKSFTLADGKTTEQVPMMIQQTGFGYFATAEATGVTLPYGAGRLEMVVVLPAGRTDLPTLEKKLDLAMWAGWLKAVKPTMVLLTMPKFKSEFDVTLNEGLKGLGITDAFDPAKADFGNIQAKGATPAERLYLSLVRHKTYIDVNEQGTEAAAATSGEIRAAAILRAQPFTADRPFLYFIRDTSTGAILFQGVLMDPLAASGGDQKPLPPQKP